jgi:hypothetical protein
VFEDVRERLGDEVVRRPLYGFRCSPARLDKELDRERDARGQRREGRGQTAIAERGGMNAASEITQLLQRLLWPSWRWMTINGTPSRAISTAWAGRG